MKAVILGCSHAAGAEMYMDPAINVEDPESFGFLNSYPVSIARQLGYEPENWAISGGSNDAMFRIFAEQLPRLTSDDIVVACWTGTDRTEVQHELTQQWLPLSVGQHNFNPTEPRSYARSGVNLGGRIPLEAEYQHYHGLWTRFHVNRQSSQLNKIKNILALNSLAQSHSIRVVNINSFYPVDSTDGVAWAVNESFCDWAERHRYPRTAWGHYFFNAHQAFADLVVTGLTQHLNAV